MAVVGVLGVVALATAACSGGGDGGDGDGGDDAGTSTSSSVGATTTVPPGGYEEPPDGGEIRVVEQGFTPGNSAPGDDHVSWGMIVENTSGYTAVNVALTVAYFDASGRSQSGSREYLWFLPAGERAPARPSTGRWP
jgi:hypothetical protein